MSFIITSDWHIRSKPPVSRIDDYLKAQWHVIEELVDFAVSQGSSLIVAGDVFHTAKPTLQLVMQLIDALDLSHNIYAIPGQHDLPGHLLSRVNESGIGLLHKCGSIKQMEGSVIINDTEVHLFPYGTELKPLEEVNCEWNMAVCHTLVTNDPNSKMEGAQSARKFLKKMKGYDLVVVGDNHKTFMIEDNGRYLISPGSLLRTNADQMDHEPCLWEWMPGYEPDQFVFDCCKTPEKELTRGHIDVREDRDERITSFVTTINNDYDVSLSFDDNMSKFLQKNKQKKSVVDLINEHMEGEHA
jgi:DNA repair exonuclease SbcCD nuclease subunit